MKPLRLHWVAAACVCLSGAQAHAALIPFVIPAECREATFGPMWDVKNGGDLKGAEAEKENKRRAAPFMWDTARAKPFVFTDKRTAISFHVAGDGRRLSAFGSSGKLLWERDPFVEAKMCPYRSPHPVIRALEIMDESEVRWAAKDPGLQIISRDSYIRVTFDSSQYGALNERTGRFTFFGQN